VQHCLVGSEMCIRDRPNPEDVMDPIIIDNWR
jgi:hypothetical protein